MSSWTEVHKGMGNGSELGAVESLQKHFAGSRILLQALTGYVPGEKNTLGRVKVSIFYEMGHVKLCLTDDLGGRLGFVTLDPENGTLEECLEAALAGGIEWRKKPEKQNWGGGGARK